MRMPAYRMPEREGDRLRAAVMKGFATRYPGPARFDATGRMETGVVAVRSYPRREPDGGVHQVRAHDRAGPAGQGRAPLPAAPARPAAPQPPQPPAQPLPRAWEERTNRAWREQIVAAEGQGRERGPAHGYDIARAGSLGAMGRYQMTPGALRGAQWQDTSGSWTERARAAGVNSRASFLANPQAQEAALDDYLRDNEIQLRRNGAFTRVGTSFPGLSGRSVTITTSGLTAAVHRHGPSATRNYIRAREAGIPPRNEDERAIFLAIETRLLTFADQSYQRLSP